MTFYFSHKEGTKMALKEPIAKVRNYVTWSPKTFDRTPKKDIKHT